MYCIIHEITCTRDPTIIMYMYLIIIINGLTSVSDENGDHETINGDDTGHDDGDDGLHDKIRSHYTHSGNTGTTLCRTISCS